MAYELDVEFKNLVDQSPLPDKLDYDKINELVMEINKKHLVNNENEDRNSRFLSSYIYN